MKLTTDMVTNYAVDLWKQNKMGFNIYWNYDLQELEAIIFIGVYCHHIKGYNAGKLITFYSEPYVAEIEKMLTQEELKELLGDKISCSMLEVENFLGKKVFESRLSAYVLREMNMEVIDTNDKYNLKNRISFIEMHPSFTGEDRSIEECVENGYLFTYNNTVFQIFPEEIRSINTLTNAKETKNVYRLYWTRNIDYSDWMKPSLDNAGVSIQTFNSMNDFEKAQIIRDYQGFHELTGLNYDTYATLEEALDGIIMGADFSKQHKSHKILVEENVPSQTETVEELKHS